MYIPTENKTEEHIDKDQRLRLQLTEAFYDQFEKQILKKKPDTMSKLKYKMAMEFVVGECLIRGKNPNG